MGEQPGAGPAAVDGQARHRRLRHRLAAAAGEGRADVADHLESAGDVVQRLGDILAHLAHRPAAGRTDARRRVHHVGARQMLRQPTATAPALHLRRHSRRFVWAFARRLVFFQFFQRQLELADHLPELLRGSAEGLRNRAICSFSVSISSALATRPARAAASSAAWAAISARSASGSSGRRAPSIGIACHSIPRGHNILNHQPAYVGRSVRRGALQSIPSSNIDSCAGLSVTAPSRACGQMNLPRSSRLANRQRPRPNTAP